jgi:hypothetical protein
VSLGDDVPLIAERDTDGLTALGSGATPDALVVELETRDIGVAGLDEA